MSFWHIYLQMFCNVDIIDLILMQIAVLDVLPFMLR